LLTIGLRLGLRFARLVACNYLSFVVITHCTTYCWFNLKKMRKPGCLKMLSSLKWKNLVDTMKEIDLIIRNSKY